MEIVKHLIDTDNIEVEVTIRLGRTRQTVAQLSSMKADDLLLLEHGIDDGVEICVGDRIIARGELTNDGTAEQRLCVRIIGAGEAG